MNKILSNRILYIPASHIQLSSIEFCWQKHDDCDSIDVNDTKFGLTNKGKHRYWHCNCDQEFYDCLHRVNSTVSNHIGELHFNFYNRCYRADFEIQKCIEYDSYIKEKRCVQYVLVLNTSYKNRWFDLPFYLGKSWEKPLFVVN